MKKYLFMDCDGVLIGNYGNDWQVRPYHKTFLNKMEKWGFDITWISMNSSIRELVKVLHLPGKMSADHGDLVMVEGRYHLSKLTRIVQVLGGIENVENTCWFMIEDEEPNEDMIKFLKKHNSLHKWIVVPDCGSDVLLDLYLSFASWWSDVCIDKDLQPSHPIVVPYEWCCRPVPKKDMSCMGKWLGYGESEREQL